MLPLDSDLWAALSHAYGPAGDVPDLLRLLAADPRPADPAEDGAWQSLWSRLCHQSDVYQASYAALPHIVKIMCETAGPIDMSFYLLPAAIEVSRSEGRGPEIHMDLRHAYFSGLADLMTGVSRHCDDPWDAATLRSALAAQAVAKGQPRLAGVLINLDEALMERLVELDYEV